MFNHTLFFMKFIFKLSASRFNILFILTFASMIFGCSNPTSDKNKIVAIDTLKLARAYNDSGLQYVRNEKNYQMGIHYFSKAIEVKPDYSVAFSNRGNAYRFLKQFDKAQSDLFIAQKLAPNDTLIHRTIARLYEDSEKYEKAIEELSIVAQMKTLDSFTLGGIYAERGKMYKKISKEILAQKDFSKARAYGFKIKTEE